MRLTNLSDKRAVKRSIYIREQERIKREKNLKNLGEDAGPDSRSGWWIWVKNGPGTGSSSTERASTKNRLESTAVGYWNSPQQPFLIILSSGRQIWKCINTKKRTIRRPTKSLPSHSPTISKQFSATHLRIRKGPSQESSWTNVLMATGPSTKVTR